MDSKRALDRFKRIEELCGNVNWFAEPNDENSCAQIIGTIQAIAMMGVVEAEVAAKYEKQGVENE